MNSEDKIRLRDLQVKLLEDLAVVNEKMGLQPAVAKVMALLTVSDEVELTFEQIMDTLNLSKGATSQAINHLLLLNRINYKTRIGDRKRYFFNKMAGWKDDLLVKMDLLKELMQVHRQVLAQRPASSATYNQNMQDLIDFLEFILQEIPVLYVRFSQEKGKL